MKLIQQTKLFFKEGTSDKVYEIDLCQLSDNEYIVNFRYGRRGSALKAGTKTPEAVTRDKADTIFSALENEKRQKGYQSEVEVFIELPSIESVNPRTPKGVILQRLQDDIEGGNSYHTEWKTSRVIWKAGQMDIQEAIPFIIKLATKGDDMQVYSSFWSLVRLQAVQAEPLFRAYAFQIKKPSYLRHMACEGLLTTLTDNELSKFTHQLLEKLPYDIRQCIENEDYKELHMFLIKHTQEKSVDYFSFLYLLCKAYPDILPHLHAVLKTWPFKEPFFKRIRSIYKLSQVRKDYPTLALITYQIEKAQGNQEKPFSRHTKAYLQRNSINLLHDTGTRYGAKEYLQLAVATLLQYSETDYRKAEEKPEKEYGMYSHQNRLYYFTLLDLPECSSSLLLSTILFGNDKERILYKNPLRFVRGKRVVASRHYSYNPSRLVEVKNSGSGLSNTTSYTTNTGNSFFDIIKSFFGGKKKVEVPKTEEAPVPQLHKEEEKETVNTSKYPLQLFPEHWNNMPAAYVQLLMQAKMNIIHQFAYNNLKDHPEFELVINRFDGKTILKLLNNEFEIPNKLGFEILDRRQSEFKSNPRFVGEVLNSNSAAARVWAQSQISSNQDPFMHDIDFLVLFISNTRKENTAWIERTLQTVYFPEDRQRALMGKLVAELLYLDNTDKNNETAKVIIKRFDIFASSQLSKVSWDIVEQLLLSPLTSNIWLASNILMQKSQRVYASEIPTSIVDLFMRSDIPEVRKNGITLLNKYPANFLTDNYNFVLNEIENPWEDVVKEVIACINRLVKTYSSLGDPTIRHMTYALIRKEKFEGAHLLIIETLKSNELKHYWNSALTPKDITKLIHSQYRESQLMGYEMLMAYNRLNDFTLPQIISFGNHELLALRNWCWNYFKQNLSRIRYEKEKALNLLDSKWDDTREYAFQFFKTEFTDSDWDTDTLISIVDSTRPDVEDFGKELINRYFKPENALEYLTKLSEHPSVNVQAFITHYLTRYASGNLKVLNSLEYYFRSVLTRVNKARIAKNRVLNFLHQEAVSNDKAAEIIVPILDDVSAQSTVQDKAACIHILTEIKTIYPHLDMHLTIKS